MWWLLATALLAAAHTVTGAEQAEMLSNAVTVQIYRVTMEEWSGSGSSTTENIMRDALLEKAVEYCGESPEKCNLKENWSGTFDSTKLKIHTVSYTKPYLTLNFTLKFNDESDKADNSETMFYIPKAALETITIDAVDTFAEETGYYIVQVNEVELSIPPNKDLNIALCIVAALMVVISLSVCIVLNYKCGQGPVPVSTEDDSPGVKTVPAPIELTAVETVRTKPVESSNGAKTDTLAVAT